MVTEGRVPHDSLAERAEGFLQRCAFDDTVSLEEMEAAPVLGEYLASCRRPDGSYVFSTEVALLWM